MEGEGDEATQWRGRRGGVEDKKEEDLEENGRGSDRW